MGNLSYPKISKVGDIIEILDVLFPAVLPHNVHIAVGTLISSEYVMVWNNNNLLRVPNLENMQVTISDKKK